MRQYLRIAGFIAALVAAPIAVWASSRTVGQVLVYDVVLTSQNPMPPNMPDFAQKRFQEVNGKPTEFTLTTAIDAVHPDGSAHVNASFVGNATAHYGHAIVDPASDFEGTLTPAGGLIPTYDASIQPSTGAGGELHMTPEIEKNNVAGSLTGRFDGFTAFAQGCGMQRTAKNGSWHVPAGPAYDRVNYAFADAGIETVAGRSVMAVKMQGALQTSAMSQTVVASGHYDPAQHVVVDFHSETHTTTARGPSSEIIDYKLRP
jgi:hypothetical protein